MTCTDLREVTGFGAGSSVVPGPGAGLIPASAISINPLVTATASGSAGGVSDPIQQVCGDSAAAVTLAVQDGSLNATGSTSGQWVIGSTLFAGAGADKIGVTVPAFAKSVKYRSDADHQDRLVAGRLRVVDTRGGENDITGLRILTVP